MRKAGNICVPLKQQARRRGSILIVALGIMIILAGLVVTLAHSMGVEAKASANYSAAIQASAVERGAEQYVIGMLIQLQQEGTTFYDLPDSDFAAVKIGNGYFWIVRPDYPNDPEFSHYGLVDESAKLNINYANEAELMALPDVTQDMADAILDWNGQGGNANNGSYYGTLPTPYQSKQAPFETVEELLLVNGFTRELLYGQGVATSTGPTIGLGQSAMPTASINTDPELTTGISDFLTVYSAVAAGTTGTTGGTGGSTGKAVANGPATPAIASRPRVNVNDAPREVLVALMEGMGLPDSDADSIIAGRNLDDQDTSTVQNILGNDWSPIQGYAGGPGNQFSADIVAVSGNGRAFKRVKIVIDASQTTPTIIYRRDLTSRGWPIDPEILSSLRSGHAIDDAQDISQAGSSI
ncbi:MAG TPA: hypothetical protein VG722_04920 [Tepidisphaeraceae bacterium]|nr:hypothetical protein [Tepidisphaeraceae bacterium]